MAEDDSTEQVIGSPTYMADVRFFFRPEDVDHMSAKGIELGTYDGAKENALAVHAHTTPPNADMPPDAAGKWSAARSETFRNWIINGCPLGVAAPQPSEEPTPPAPGARVRRNVAGLSAEEIDTLRKAFTGLMERDPSQTDSYFALAGIHGLPQARCLHHENRYNPWHRVYLKVFEDALRSIEGCEDVTIPYWDIATPLPEPLQQPPFASYTLPRDPGVGASPPVPGVFFPYTTERYAPSVIAQNVQGYGVLDDIETSRKQSVWGAYNINGYQDFSIQAHDGGHGSIGPTMAEQNVASYDPVFWFFHCNLDRLWLSWQRSVSATTLAGFKSTITGDATWLSAPFNELKPFSTTADETIDFGISYEEPALEISEEVVLENMTGNVDAARSFSIKRSTPVSVRVKEIDRLSIPGSFAVHLLADGEPIAKRAFFQPRRPSDCDTCRAQALINIDIRVDQAKLLDRKLSVEIEVLGHGEIGRRFPVSRAGNPTINARLLLEDQ